MPSGRHGTGAGGVGQWTRRGAVGALAAAGAGFVLFGPRSAREAPAGRVVLDYWEKWTGQEGEAMRAVVDAFNASQDRIYVRYFSMSAINQKAMVAIAGGDPPDLVGLWNFFLPQFVGAGALTPLGELESAYGAEIDRAFADRYGADDSGLREEYYAPQLWRLMHHEDVIGGAVNTCSTMGLYYSRAAFREVGLDPDDPPKTIEELDAAERRLTVRDASGKFERAGFLHREPGWWNWVWGYHFGGSLWDKQTNRATASAPENVRAYGWLQSYPERYGTDTLVSFQSGFGNYNSVQQPLLDGSVAMVLHGSFIANVIERFKPDFDYGAAPFPVEARLYDPQQPIGLLEADVLCIPRGAKHPREAYEFLRFTQRREWVEWLASAHAKPSPLRRVSPGFEEGHPNRYIGVHNLIAQSDRAFPKPLTRAWPQYEQEFNANIDAFWEARRPAKDILESIDRRMQRILDETRAKRLRRQESLS